MLYKECFLEIAVGHFNLKPSDSDRTVIFMDKRLEKPKPYKKTSSFRIIKNIFTQLFQLY